MKGVFYDNVSSVVISFTFILSRYQRIVTRHSTQYNNTSPDLAIAATLHKISVIGKQSGLRKHFFINNPVQCSARSAKQDLMKCSVESFVRCVEIFCQFASVSPSVSPHVNRSILAALILGYYANMFVDKHM